jgi:hypothetical protein
MSPSSLCVAGNDFKIEFSYIVSQINEVKIYSSGVFMLVFMYVYYFFLRAQLLCDDTINEERISNEGTTPMHKKTTQTPLRRF